MKFISVSTIVASVAFFKVASAHATVRNYWVNGVDKGLGVNTYIRSPPSNSPVKDLKSAAVACNLNGATAVSGFVEVPAGATLEPEWMHDNRGDDIIDGSHKGPIVSYLAPFESNGEGAVWVKIAEENYDGKQWPIDKIKANNGRHSVKIPAGLAPGKYLFRTEILALHESDTLFSANSARGIQLYPSCGQITVTGSGSITLPAGTSFPGEYKDSDPGIHFNLYNADPNSYIVPGPAVWDGVNGGSPAPTVPAPSPSTTPAAPSSVIVPPVSPPAAPSASSVAPQPSPSKPVTLPSPPVVPKPSTTPSQPAPTTPATTPAQPAPTKPAGGVKDANVCMNEYNQCIAKSQPKPDWEGCSAIRDGCLSEATYNTNMLVRAKRDGKFGRLL